MEKPDPLEGDDYPAFLGSEIEPPKATEARFHVLPVPYERSVSYGGGTAGGPAAILRASWQLETWDGKSTPCDQGIHTHPPVGMARDDETALGEIAGAVSRIVQQGGFPVALGGEHTVTLGVVQGLIDAGHKDIGVVQIDAHADLRESYESNRLSHASVMKRIVDLGVPVFQLGVRALCEEEVRTRVACCVRHLDADLLVPDNIGRVDLPGDFPRNVFFTLDVDGLDPSIFPSTGTPVPGGLGWYQTLSLFESVVTERQVMGFDLMEFAPIQGFHAFDFSAALLVYKMMGIVARKG